MEERRKRQAERLRRIRYSDSLRAYKLWVAYFDQPLMGGWHAFLETYGNFGLSGQRVWINRDMQRMKSVLLETFPLAEPGADQWQRWLQAFAWAYERRWQDRWPVGVVYVWWNGHDSRLRIAQPTPK
jgi:hypothetical protein